MLTETRDYAKLYRDFRWDIPARFNIATACCDRHADGTGRPALILVDEDGAAQRTSFDEMQALSRRFANVLKADGLIRGDRVAAFLSQSLELPITHLAAFRSGLVSVPLFALFGEDALEFRLANSGARAVVTDEAGWEKLSKIRDRLPYLQDIYITSEAVHAGAKSFWSAIETASEHFATTDTAADDPAIIIYTSGTTGNPKGALHAHRVLLGHLPNVEMVHDFLPKPDDVMWTPADWAWIGGLFDALFPAWYHGVPVVGHRARKFEPQAAMAADGRSCRAQRVPAADRAEADAAGGSETSRRQTAQHADRAANRSAPNFWTGCARPSASMPMRSMARPNAISWSAAIRNCFRSVRDRWDAPRRASTSASSTSAARNCRGASAASSACASPTPAP